MSDSDNADYGEQVFRESFKYQLKKARTLEQINSAGLVLQSAMKNGLSREHLAHYQTLLMVARNKVENYNKPTENRLEDYPKYKRNKGEKLTW
jgi:hypothetical protein